MANTYGFYMLIIILAHAILMTTLPFILSPLKCISQQLLFTNIKIHFIKQIVPVLDSDWLSHGRSHCKLHYKPTPLFSMCIACATTLFQPQLFPRNYIVWWKNTVFINIITLICSVLFCETLLSIWNNHFIKAISTVKPWLAVNLTPVKSASCRA